MTFKIISRKESETFEKDVETSKEFQEITKRLYKENYDSLIVYGFENGSSKREIYYRGLTRWEKIEKRKD